MKLIRMSTVGLSLDVFCRGLLTELKAEGYDVTALSSPDAELARLGEREGVRTVGVRMRRDISPLSDLVSHSFLSIFSLSLSPSPHPFSQSSWLWLLSVCLCTCLLCFPL